jgi:hypothetical protein
MLARALFLLAPCPSVTTMQISQENKPGIMNRAQNLVMDRLLIFGVAFISDMLLVRAGHEREVRASMGLEAFRHLDRSLVISGNAKIVDLAGFDNLKEVQKETIIQGNANLQSFDGFGKIAGAIFQPSALR